MPQQKPTFDFHMGADPECTFVRNGRAASAAQIMDIAFNGDIVSKKAGSFGKDGHAETAELRPAPGKSPEQITEHIGELIKTFTDKDFCLDLITESKYKPIGGHIHFELRSGENSDRYQSGLHAFISAMYLPLMLGENKKSMVSRIKNGYGQLKDYRTHNPIGSVYTQEFRTPNADWLTSQKLTHATFAYWFVVYHEFRKDPKKFKNIILGNEALQLSMQTLAMERPEIVEAEAKKVIELVKTFEHYEAYKKEIDFVTDWEKVLAHKEDMKYSIRNGWGAPLANVSIRSIAKKYTKEAENDYAVNMLRPMHNGDNNTEFFANVLAMIQANNKKTLRHSYFIYGVREADTPVISLHKDIVSGAENANTEQSYAHIKEMINRMYEKIRERVGAEEAKKVYAIGLPRAMRNSGDILSFLRYIKQCEKGELTTAQAFTPVTGKNITTKQIQHDDGRRAEIAYGDAPPSGFYNLSEEEILALA